jgi:hypothetical protein
MADDPRSQPDDEGDVASVSFAAPPLMPAPAPPPPPPMPAAPPAWGDPVAIWRPAPAPWTPPRRRLSFLQMLAVGVVFLVIGAGAVALVVRPWASEYPSEWDPRVRSIASDVERARGLEFEHPVEVHFLSEAEFEERLTGGESLAEADRAAIAQGAAELRALGLVAGGVDVFEASRDASATGTLAFYDPDAEEVFVRGEVVDVAHEVTLAHELTHVLQDQHFDIRALEERAFTSDAGDSSALAALIEGDATRIEDDYLRGLSAAERGEYDAQIRNERERIGADTVTTPPILLFQLGAPYTFGPYTVRVLLAEGGNAAVDAALEGPAPSARMFLEPGVLDATDGPEPVLPDGVRALGTSEPFSAFDAFVVLGARGPAHEALRAADAVTAGNYATYEGTGGTNCIQVAMGTRGTAARATLATAFRRWAATMPGAAVADTGNAVRVTSCDPGAQGSGPAEADVRDAETLLALRGELTAAFAEEGLPADRARCAARVLAGRTDLFPIFLLEDLAPDQQSAVADAARLSAQTCATNPAAGLDG